MSQAATQQAESNIVNGLDLGALGAVVEEIQKDPSKALASFVVETTWLGQTRTETATKSMVLGGQNIPRNFVIATDEPFEVLGENTAPNPQEVLMAAMNACISVGYVAGAAVRGITLESLEILTEGSLDLRGFLGLDDTVPPGYESLTYTVRIKGNGTEEQFREIHETVKATSPNYFNIANPVALHAHLHIHP